MFFDMQCDCGTVIKNKRKSDFLKWKNFCCRQCRQENIDRKIILEDLIGQKFNKLTIINAYREKRKNSGAYRILIDCICECGNVRKRVEWYKLKSGTVYSCRQCAKSISAMEIFIMNFLNENNISYIYQKKFDNCRDILPLPFDFYLTDFNILVEYDGEQHFIAKSFGNFDLETIQKHDKIKNDYAINNNIKLIRFNYLQNKEIITNELLSIIGCESKNKY